ncbi:hypothetical protein EJ110_NYTH24743 [Nymphaea thermarum]|nr:hypothetical protein EJ110_NYTH24743 [Nymphaea thermarum]
MSLHPPNFHGKGTADDAEAWIRGIEKIFTTLSVPDNKKVQYGTFMLKEDAEEWWLTQRKVKFANHEATWREFKEVFTHAYIPAFTREQRMQKFLDLRQRSMSLHEYVVKFRHLEKYCPHVYTTDADKANKFVRGLKDGLRREVMGSRPRDLDDAIDMTTRFDEDSNGTHETDRRSELLGPKSSPDTFKRRSSDRVNQEDQFKRHRPSSFRQDEECLTCHRQHPGKPCYREVGACLYCETRGHFIRECPKKKEAEQSRFTAVAASGRQKTSLKLVVVFLTVTVLRNGSREGTVVAEGAGRQVARRRGTERQTSREKERSLSLFWVAEDWWRRLPPSVEREEEGVFGFVPGGSGALELIVVAHSSDCTGGPTRYWAAQGPGVLLLLGDRHLLVPQTGFLEGPCCCSGDLGYLRRLHFRYSRSVRSPGEDFLFCP